MERITLLLIDGDILARLISNPASPNAPFTWPNLRHLELRTADIDYWSVAEASDLFTQFLIAHPLLQTLILCSHRRSRDIQLPSSFSLAPYPHALPNLRILRAPLGIIAGILESTCAASLIAEVADSSVGLVLPEDCEQLLGRIVSAFKRISDSPLRRLELQVPRFDYNTFMQLSKYTPNLKVLELDRSIMDQINQDHPDTFAMMVSSALALMHISHCRPRVVYGSVRRR